MGQGIFEATGASDIPLPAVADFFNLQAWRKYNLLHVRERKFREGDYLPRYCFGVGKTAAIRGPDLPDIIKRTALQLGVDKSDYEDVVFDFYNQDFEDPSFNKYDRGKAVYYEMDAAHNIDAPLVTIDFSVHGSFNNDITGNFRGFGKPLPEEIALWGGYYTIFHELRHATFVGRAISAMFCSAIAETDADIFALNAIKILGAPNDAVDVVIKLRNLEYFGSETHQTGLFLHEHFIEGRTLNYKEDEERSRAIYAGIYGLLGSFGIQFEKDTAARTVGVGRNDHHFFDALEATCGLSVNFQEQMKLTYYLRICDALEGEAVPIDPDVSKQMQLFKAAVEFFVPGVVQARQAMKKRNLEFTF